MTEYPLSLVEIVAWLRSKERSLAGSKVSIVNIRDRAEHKPAACADFDGTNSIGRIDAWVSGEFDFHVLRVSDGADIFWRHAEVAAVNQLESVYAEFIESLGGHETA